MEWKRQTKTNIETRKYMIYNIHPRHLKPEKNHQTINYIQKKTKPWDCILGFQVRFPNIFLYPLQNESDLSPPWLFIGYLFSIEYAKTN
jgi:hypothetical protein